MRELLLMRWGLITSPLDGQTVTGVITVAGSIPQTLDAAGSHLLVDGQFLTDRRITNGPYL